MSKIYLLIVGLALFSVGASAQIKKKPAAPRSITAGGAAFSVGVRVNAVGDGETFQFSLGAGRNITVIAADTVVNFTGALRTGLTYAVSQTSGPRTCQLTPNLAGTISNSNIVIDADCGTPPGRAFLDGIFIAPPGTIVDLQYNSVDKVSLTAKSDGNAQFSATPFKFPKLYVIGTAYQLNITSSSAGQVCSIEKGRRGTVGLSPGFIRVGCDYGSDLVSRSSDNTKFGTFYESTAPVVGGPFEEEGRYVAFVSSAVGLGSSSGKKRQIIWRDRNSGETRLVSVGINGAEGNGDSFAPSISADGLSVAFESYATNLVPIDTNGVRDIFVWSAKTNSVTAVSTGAGEIETNAESFEPTISGDGSLVAFSSGASNLAPGVSGINTINVYLKRVGSGQSPILISIDPKTKKGVGGSNPSISEDGSRVAFYSYASTLVPNDKNGLWDIFLWDARIPKLKRITVPSFGSERDQGTESISRVVAPSISSNGGYVAFATTSTNLVPGDTNNVQDVFVANVDAGEIRRLSVNMDRIEGNAESPSGQGEKIAVSWDGSWVAFTTKATNLGGSIILKNTQTGETRSIAPSQGTVGTPAISRNGGYVVFGSSDRNDGRYQSSGIFARFTGITRCRFCTR